MGYTAITPVGQLAPDAKVVVKEPSLSMPSLPMSASTNIKINLH